MSCALTAAGCLDSWQFLRFRIWAERVERSRKPEWSEGRRGFESHPPWAHDLILADDILLVFGSHFLNLEITLNYFRRDFAGIHNVRYFAYGT